MVKQMTDMDVISNGIFLFWNIILTGIFLGRSSGYFYDPGSHGCNNVVAGGCNLDIGRRASGMVSEMCVWHRTFQPQSGRPE